MARRRTLDEDEEEDDRRSTVRRSAKRRPSSSPAPLSLLEQPLTKDDEVASILQSARQPAARSYIPPDRPAYSPAYPTMTIPPGSEVAPGIPARNPSAQAMPVFRGGPVPTFAQGDQPYPDMSGQANYSRGQFQQPVQGLVFHHTGGRGDAQGVINTLNNRGLGVHYVMDRDGKVYQTLPSGARGAHMKPSEIGNGLSNANTIGIEVIAADDRDLTPAQIEASKGFRDYVAQRYNFDPNNVYGHGALNTHKQKTEGSTIVNALRGTPMAPPPAPAPPAPTAPAFTSMPLQPFKPVVPRPQAAAPGLIQPASTGGIGFNQQGRGGPGFRGMGNPMDIAGDMVTPAAAQSAVAPSPAFAGGLADRQPGAPLVNDTGPPPPPARPPAPEQRTGPLADRLPNAPPVQNAPQRPLPTQWSQTVHNAPAPGPNENVAQALRDQALREGRMPWAAQAGSGEPSPGIGWGSLFGGGGSSTSPPPSSNPQQRISLVDMLTNPFQSARNWFA